MIGGVKHVVVNEGQEEKFLELFRTLKAENDALKARMDVIERGSNPNRAGFTYGNGGWGVAGLAFGALLVSSRRKRSEQAA